LNGELRVENGELLEKRIEKRGAFKFRIKEVIFKLVNVVFDKKDIDKLQKII